MNDSLWRGFARSVRANAVGELILQGVRLGGMIVLARGLTPADFGVFRVLMIVWSFGVVPIECGLPDALIQRQDLRPRHEATAWFLSVAAAAATAMVLYFAAPVIARAMAIPGTSTYIRWLCIPFVVEGTAMVSSARLRRELRFGAVAAAEVASEVAFLAVAIAVLFTPYAHSSLAAGLAARITAYSLALWIADHRFVAAMPTLASARELGRFSVTVWGAALIHNASFNADFILVGRWLGPSALGFYSMAWDLLRFVPDRLHRVVGRVAFPAFARMRDNQELRDAFLEFFGYMARLVIPVMVLAIVTAPDLIGTVYGAQWIPTVVPLRLLAAGFILVGLRLGIGPIFYAKDHPSFDIYLHGVRLVRRDRGGDSDRAIWPRRRECGYECRRGCCEYIRDLSGVQVDRVAIRASVFRVPCRSLARNIVRHPGTSVQSDGLGAGDRRHPDARTRGDTLNYCLRLFAGRSCQGHCFERVLPGTIEARCLKKTGF
jgi:O-antigen/teichoic acid export membrane protein